MALLPLSTGTLYAGQWGPMSIVGGSPLGPLGGATVTVFESDGSTAATLYADETKATPLAGNAVTTDTTGTLTIYADPGVYVLSFAVGTTLTTRTIVIEPWYTDGAWNDVVDTTASGGTGFSPLSGDCRLCNATAGAGTYDLAAPALGTHYRVVKTDASVNTVTLSTATGTINGPNGQSAATYVLNAQGAYVEVVGDGTNYDIVGGAGGGGGEVAKVERAAIVTANTYQNGATYTSPAQGRYLALVTFLVPSGGAAVAAEATYTMDGLAQTAVIYPTGQGNLAQGAYSPSPLFIDVDASTAITIEVQSSSTATLVTTAITEV